MPHRRAAKCNRDRNYARNIITPKDWKILLNARDRSCAIIVKRILLYLFLPKYKGCIALYATVYMYMRVCIMNPFFYIIYLP